MGSYKFIISICVLTFGLQACSDNAQKLTSTQDANQTRQIVETANTSPLGGGEGAPSNMAKVPLGATSSSSSKNDDSDDGVFNSSMIWFLASAGIVTAAIIIGLHFQNKNDEEAKAKKEAEAKLTKKPTDVPLPPEVQLEPSPVPSPVVPASQPSIAPTEQPAPTSSPVSTAPSEVKMDSHGRLGLCVTTTVVPDKKSLSQIYQKAE